MLRACSCKTHNLSASVPYFQVLTRLLVLQQFPEFGVQPRWQVGEVVCQLSRYMEGGMNLHEEHQRGRKCSINSQNANTIQSSSPNERDHLADCGRAHYSVCYL